MCWFNSHHLFVFKLIFKKNFQKLNQINKIDTLYLERLGKINFHGYAMCVFELINLRNGLNLKQQNWFHLEIFSFLFSLRFRFRLFWLDLLQFIISMKTTKTMFFVSIPFYSWYFLTCVVCVCVCLSLKQLSCEW